VGSVKSTSGSRLRYTRTGSPSLSAENSSSRLAKCQLVLRGGKHDETAPVAVDRSSAVIGLPVDLELEPWLILLPSNSDRKNTPLFPSESHLNRRLR